MKSQHFLIFILIALGAIIGSTLATISYLNNRESTPNSPTNLPVTSSTDTSPEISSPSLPTSTPSQESLSTKPKANDFLQFRSLLGSNTKTNHT